MTRWKRCGGTLTNQVDKQLSTTFVAKVPSDTLRYSILPCSTPLSHSIVPDPAVSYAGAYARKPEIQNPTGAG
jgi:lipocalin